VNVYLPREHGAYGQMAFPLVTAFGVAGVSAGGLLMATAVIYSLPPAALYYAVRKYMVSGLTAGATKA